MLILRHAFVISTLVLFISVTASLVSTAFAITTPMNEISDVGTDSMNIIGHLNVPGNVGDASNNSSGTTESPVSSSMPSNDHLVMLDPQFVSARPSNDHLTMLDPPFVSAKLSNDHLTMLDPPSVSGKPSSDHEVASERLVTSSQPTNDHKEMSELSITSSLRPNDHEVSQEPTVTSSLSPHDHSITQEPTVTSSLRPHDHSITQEPPLTSPRPTNDHQTMSEPSISPSLHPNDHDVTQEPSNTSPLSANNHQAMSEPSNSSSELLDLKITTPLGEISDVDTGSMKMMGPRDNQIDESRKNSSTKDPPVSALPSYDHLVMLDPSFASSRPSHNQTVTSEPSVTSSALMNDHEARSEPSITSSLRPNDHEVTQEPSITSSLRSNDHEVTQEPSITSSLRPNDHEIMLEPSNTSSLSSNNYEAMSEPSNSTLLVLPITAPSREISDFGTESMKIMGPLDVSGNESDASTKRSGTTGPPVSSSLPSYDHLIMLDPSFATSRRPLINQKVKSESSTTSPPPIYKPEEISEPSNSSSTLFDSSVTTPVSERSDMGAGSTKVMGTFDGSGNTTDASRNISTTTGHAQFVSLPSYDHLIMLDPSFATSRRPSVDHKVKSEPSTTPSPPPNIHKAISGPLIASPLPPNDHVKMLEPADGHQTTIESPVMDSGEGSCPPWFQCVNGVCNGGMSCRCFEGWAGLFCEEPCPKDCSPYGTCTTSSSNQALCVCNETSIYSPDSGCVDRTPAPPTSTTETPSTTPADLRPMDDRECVGIFTCVHGYCQAMSLMCECDQGWRGELCDQTCDLNCGSHGKCRESREFMMYCECDPSFEGDTCDNVIQTNTDASATTSETSSRGINSKANSTMMSSPVSRSSSKNVYTTEATTAVGRSDLSRIYDNVTSKRGSTTNPTTTTTTTMTTTTTTTMTTTTTTRAVSERQCLPGFVCQHGHCAKGRIACVCDEGWGGIFCNQACVLPCGENGTCAFTEEESQYCKCEQGYTSDRSCEGDEGGIRFNSSVEKHEAWRHLEPEYGQLPPYAQRSCLSDYICAYGNCSGGEKSKCLCEPGFTGAFCQIPCPIECGHHGKCIYNYANNTAECFCDFHYGGPNCTEIIQQEETESMPVVWALCLAAALFLVSLLLLVVLPLILYKRRNITMMKIVHWFQPFEEDDDRDYDAFVSYASSVQDTQFVLNTLVPKLEGRLNFTLCIHQRNFIPGQFISDNIMESVKRSRRTLLILSPSFVSSGWCRFEYQMALQEMLNEKHRVLPILIGDIRSLKNEIDDALKNILRTVTWLEYPSKNASEQEHEKFWKRLELSMPKKRPSHIESGNGHICLAMPSSMPTGQSQHKTVPPKARLCTKECRSNRLLQRIVRVPAYKLNSYDQQITPAGLTFDRFLEKLADVDSQNGTTGSESADASLRLKNSEPSLSESSGDAARSSTFDASETEQINYALDSPNLSDLRTDTDISAQNHETLLDNGSSCEMNDQEEDIPACMFHSYVGALDLKMPVTA